MKYRIIKIDSPTEETYYCQEKKWFFWRIIKIKMLINNNCFVAVKAFNSLRDAEGWLTDYRAQKAKFETNKVVIKNI